MSTLEIVLYIIIGGIVIWYVAHTIYKIVDQKKHPEKYDENGKKKKKGGLKNEDQEED